ncbi:DUF2202 domain-containing protein [Stieleria sp. JC731]|uniref:DUF2202 domain-containing protein n=1 Tax=Pirellulaceae TaxID=2691357 RepID=UPI001E4B8285|nr:DUF2202 domain-containing protein [Stieleria sp. JC731]MCC9601082.1 DUF2202 domain-containing protein [Stieleria sp. JC731]
MKRSLISLGALLALLMAAPDVLSQQRRGNGAPGQGRGGDRAALQTQTATGTLFRGVNAGGMQSQANARTRMANQGQASGNLLENNGAPDLLRMREEEKLARDVYTHLAKTSTLPIFRNISRAESQHMQAIERLLRGGGGEVFNDNPGVFAFADYRQLYETLVASGSRSSLDALKVGAKIEEMDIADLRQVLNQTNDPQVRQVLQHLMHGSQNHLRAFASQILKQGSSYNAEFLSQADFDQIVNSTGKGRGGQRQIGARQGGGGKRRGR